MRRTASDVSGACRAGRRRWRKSGSTASYVETITASELSESLYLYYRRKLRLWITRAEDQIGLGVVPDWTLPVFEQPPGAPVPLVTRVSQVQDGTRAEVSRTWFDPQIARYVARLK